MQGTLDDSSLAVSAIWRAGKLAALGYVLIGAIIATVIIGSSHANRPHEVKGETLIVILLAVHAVLSIAVLVLLFSATRARRSKGLRAFHFVIVLFAGGYSFLIVSCFTLIGVTFVLRLL